MTLCAQCKISQTQLGMKEPFFTHTRARAGILFSMLEAAGMKETWLFQKARVLAIFDDLDTILLMVPLKVRCKTTTPKASETKAHRDAPHQFIPVFRAILKNNPQSQENTCTISALSALTHALTHSLTHALAHSLTHALKLLQTS